MRNRPVVFVEHVIAGTGISDSGFRRSRWFSAAAVSSATKPMVMTDSGFKYLQGNQSEGFETAYRRIVELSMREAPLVAIEAYQERVGIQSALRVHGKITNIGSLVLGDDNTATLNVIVFESTKVANVNNAVRKAVSVDIDDLDPGQTYEFDVEVTDLGRANMTKIQAIVLVDYKPGGEHRAYVSANAALASKDPPPEPTDEPEPTAEPTAEPTEEPTAEPTEDPTGPTEEPAPTEPTAEPTPTTAPPTAGSSIFLPSARNRG